LRTYVSLTPDDVGRLILTKVRVAVVALVAACKFENGTAWLQPDAPSDPLIDAAVCSTWTARHFDPCSLPPPSQPLDLTGDWTFDTDTGMLAPATGTPIMPSGTSVDQGYIVSIEGLTIEANGTLTVIGSKPLIVAAWEQIAIAGKLDAGSTPSRTGAGGNPASCMGGAKQGATGVSTGGSGGGGGGAFAGNGGHGGTGDNPQGPLGGAGGAARASPTTPIGGCSGAPSGAAGVNSAPDPAAIAVAGIGGGAVQLSARVSISISAGGFALAGGGGGGGAPQGSACGGGGGGAGGYLGFDAPSIVFAGTVAANGGAGGSGGPYASFGFAGQDGQPSDVAATGGAATSCSEMGMSGGAGAMADGATSTNPVESCGGAGGGGGVGFVLTWGTVTPSGTPTISPPAQPGG